MKLITVLAITTLLVSSQAIAGKPTKDQIPNVDEPQATATATVKSSKSNSSDRTMKQAQDAKDALAAKDKMSAKGTATPPPPPPPPPPPRNPNCPNGNCIAGTRG